MDYKFTCIAALSLALTGCNEPEEIRWCLIDFDSDRVMDDFIVEGQGNTLIHDLLNAGQDRAHYDIVLLIAEEASFNFGELNFVDRSIRRLYENVDQYWKLLETTGDTENILLEGVEILRSGSLTSPMFNLEFDNEYYSYDCRCTVKTQGNIIIEMSGLERSIETSSYAANEMAITINNFTSEALNTRLGVNGTLKVTNYFAVDVDLNLGETNEDYQLRNIGRDINTEYPTSIEMDLEIEAISNTARIGHSIFGTADHFITRESPQSTEIGFFQPDIDRTMLLSHHCPE